MYKEIEAFDIINNPKKVNVTISNNVRHLRNDISILIDGNNFELDRIAKNDLITLAKNIIYYLGDKYV